MTPHKQHVGILYFPMVLGFFFFYIGVLDHSRLPLGVILFLRETQEWSCGLENTFRGLNNIEMSIKCMNYPFKLSH